MPLRCLADVMGINETKQAESKQRDGEPLIRLFNNFR